MPDIQALLAKANKEVEQESTQVILPWILFSKERMNVQKGI